MFLGVVSSVIKLFPRLLFMPMPPKPIAGPGLKPAILNASFDYPRMRPLLSPKFPVDPP